MKNIADIIRRQEQSSAELLLLEDQLLSAAERLHILSQESSIKKATEIIGNKADPETIQIALALVNTSSVNKEYISAIHDYEQAMHNYYSKYFEYLGYIANDRSTLFSHNYQKRIDELALKGCFLYFLQTPDFSLDELSESHWEQSIIEHFADNLGLFFSAWIKRGNLTKNNLQKSKTLELESAIRAFNNNDYNSFARTIFALMENDSVQAANLEEQSKLYQRDPIIKKKIASIGYDYYINAYNMISAYYQKLTCNTDKWDKLQINRNALMHGNYERKTTKLDCIMLLTMFVSFKELTSVIIKIDALISYIKTSITAELSFEAYKINQN